jgi:PAS domain-containing protein
VPRDIELVLLKQLSSCLAIPMIVVGADGSMIFFNESAEPLLGLRFEETGELTLEEWGEALESTDANGRLLDSNERPVMGALELLHPVHARMFLRGMDGLRREVEATAFPLISETGAVLGVLGLLWQPGGSARLQPVASPSHRRQHDVEAILMRRLASYLATPIFFQGVEGQLLYFNAAAAPILGRPFEEMKGTTRGELYASFSPMALDGSPLKPEEHPLTIAREQHVPAHLRFAIRGMDNVMRTIEATAFPLIGQSRRNLGAVGVFWEIKDT